MGKAKAAKAAPPRSTGVDAETAGARGRPHDQGE